jgi:altronate hydrolase
MPGQPPPSLPSALCLHHVDDVAVALKALTRGSRVAINRREVDVTEDIPPGHKFALRTIAEGEEVRKYGAPIGRAYARIEAGSWVHTHNLRTQLAGAARFDHRRAPRTKSVSSANASRFLGYRRHDGRVATRNEIWVLCSVGCVARTAERIARIAGERHAGEVDGVHALTHPLGCSQLGDDLSRTRRLIAALARHPNAGGVLLLGLGCESNQLEPLLAELGGYDPARLRTLSAQAVADELDAGLEAVAELVAVARSDRREPCSTADLRLGLKCGGSDGFSGITANPLVGRVTDRCVSAGGTAILTEIPEVFGAERVLLGRAVTRDVHDRLARILADFRQYFIDHGEPVHENPSPGNVEGGITTLEEKSLGAVQKGGRAPVTQALRYAEGIAQGAGLAVLEAPGNDAVSSTALVASGATVLLFTTGRGTPLGFPVPTIKIASNSDLARRKPAWIDFDAGPLAAGADPEQMATALFDLVLETASGRRARNEINDEREIAIWKQGVTL